MHSHKHLRVAVFAFVACAFGSAMGYAQSTDDSEPTLAIPSSKLQVRFDMLGAGYWDFDQATLGHESQGRIGWAILGISGEINPYISFDAELNPVNEQRQATTRLRRGELLLPERALQARTRRGLRARRPEPC